MFEKAKKFLLTCRLELDEFESIQNKIAEINRLMLILVAAATTAIVGSLAILSVFIEDIRQNQPLYLIGVIIAFLLMTLAKSLLKTSTSISLLVDGYLLLFYGYGIIIGVFLNRVQHSVTFIIMLILLPLCFINRPIRTFTTSIVYTVIFVVLCSICKTGSAQTIDIINAILYGIFGATIGSIVHCLHCRGYVYEHKLQTLSQIDQLTRLNNRNAFEETLKLLPDSYNKSLACIYLDVNGLHELNNNFGHVAGDRMLTFIADRIAQYFGREFTFRIGGDEFVIFIIDGTEAEIQSRLSSLTAEINQAMYHVATGFDIKERGQKFMIKDLIGAAEEKMYADKCAFYKTSGHNRRCRR